MSALEEQLALQIRAAGLPEPEREVRFAPPRRWRFDFLFRPQMVAIEVDGATWSYGRHSRGSGIETDCEKVNTAQLMGYRVLRVTGDMVMDGRALAFIEKALKA